MRNYSVAVVEAVDEGWVADPGMSWGTALAKSVVALSRSTSITVEGGLMIIGDSVEPGKGDRDVLCGIVAGLRSTSITVEGGLILIGASLEPNGHDGDVSCGTVTTSRSTLITVEGGLILIGDSLEPNGHDRDASCERSQIMGVDKLGRGGWGWGTWIWERDTGGGL
jgi:hypothetical protein